MSHDKKCKHSRRKSSMRKCKTPKHKTRRIRKMRGGVSFNDSLSTSSLPSTSYYPLNEYVGGDPSRDIISSRLLPNMGGGKNRKHVSRRNRTKRSRRRRAAAMRGGSLIGTDLLTGLNTSTTNHALGFATTGGTTHMYNSLTGTANPGGPELQPSTPMVPVA